MAKKIMLVHDKSDVCSTIKTLLEKNDYEVIIAYNAEECIKKLKNNKPDLILINGIMNRSRVLEVASKLTGVKIAYLIVDESEEENLKLYKNVIGFINEPRNINEFLKKIKELIR